MRILVYDTAADSGGAATVLESFYEEFSKDTKNRYVFVLGRYELQRRANIRVLCYPWVKKSPLHRLYFEWVKAPRIIKKYRIDRVLSLQNITLPRAGVPQDVYEHNALPFSEYRFHLWDGYRPWLTQQLLGRMMKHSIRHAQKVMLQPRWLQEALVQQCGIPEKKVEVKFPVVEMLQAGPWQMDDSRPVFLYPANASAYKNHRTLLAACELLKERGFTDYHMIWTVTGEENDGICELKKAAERERLPIVFQGPVARRELFDLYASSILVFPSYVETVGMPLLEVQSIGAPLLAADCLYARDIVGDYERAQFLPVFDASAWSAAMQKWLEN
ncbi:MAG: glycosyltransferase [Lachnospiraceae bacterium]|nr:glycosyltransferase [Lachnospiraceae bacterium]